MRKAMAFVGAVITVPFGISFLAGGLDSGIHEASWVGLALLAASAFTVFRLLRTANTA